MKDCLVIGAGMAGLTAARILNAAGVQVTVLDKGRQVGGRLATRRIDEGVFDHGAQFITARRPEFTSLIEEMQAAGEVYEWCRGIGSLAEPARQDGYPRYQGTGGMTAIPKYLARGLDVRVRQRVTQLKVAGGRWQATLESGHVVSGEALLCTTPAPQALDLLDLGGHELPDAERGALERIKYQPCISAMAVLNGPAGLPSPGALRDVDDTISFLCDNQRKGISPGAAAVTIHASAAFSREHWASEERGLSQWLLSRATPLLASSAQSVTLHRWRYAMPVELHPEACLRVPGEAPLVFAGDAFNGPRVEGAAISGMAAAQALLGD